MMASARFWKGGLRTYCRLVQQGLQRQVTSRSKGVVHSGNPVALTLMPNPPHQSHKTYSSKSGSRQISREEAVDFMRQHPGGSVDLSTESASTAVITLNNPAKKNALTGTMMLELSDVVSDLEAFKGRFVVLRGAEGFFSAGADLALVRDTIQNGMGKVIPTIMHEVTSRLMALPLVSVALIEGSAIGGGAELTTFCDFRMATEHAQIVFKHVHLGTVPGFGGATALVSILGKTAALDLLCSSRPLSALEAERLGLVNCIISQGTSEQSLLRCTQWLCERFPYDTPAFGGAKSIVHKAASQATEISLAHEAEVFARVWGNQSHRKAVGLDQDS